MVFWSISDKDVAVILDNELNFYGTALAVPYLFSQ